MNVNDTEFTGEYTYTMANFKIPLKEPSATVDVKSDAEPSTDDRIPQSNAVQSNSNIQTSVPVVDQPQQNPNGNNNIRPFKRLNPAFIEGLPEELVKLFKPLCCDLCSTKLNSPTTARSHYESKNHAKKTQAWLVEWSSRTNEPMPKRPNLKVETSGSSSTHCEVCDLALTSVQHAKQHYLGKKHRNAMMGRGKPKGQGYYDTDNKWVRLTSTEDPTNRFGIGESFLAVDKGNAATAEKTSTVDKQQTTPTHDNDGVLDEFSLQPPPPPPPPSQPTPSTTTEEANATVSPEEIAALKMLTTAVEGLGKYCDICDISVNMESHMRLHLIGAKHAKQLRKLGAPPYQDITIAHSLNKPLHIKPAPNQPGTFDYSVFRTPSGQYYCNVCNLTMPSEGMLAQHMTSKKHSKTVRLKK